MRICSRLMLLFMPQKIKTIVDEHIKEEQVAELVKNGNFFSLTVPGSGYTQTIMSKLQLLLRGTKVDNRRGKIGDPLTNTIYGENYVSSFIHYI